MLLRILECTAGSCGECIAAAAQRNINEFKAGLIALGYV